MPFIQSNDQKMTRHYMTEIGWDIKAINHGKIWLDLKDWAYIWYPSQ